MIILSHIPILSKSFIMTSNLGN